MAFPNFDLSLLLLFVAMPYSSLSLSCPATSCECELSLQLYLHQIVQGQPTHNQVVTTETNEPGGFGMHVIVDWAVVDAIQPNATVIAHAKGQLVRASVGFPARYVNYFSVVFQNGRFSESTLEVMGNFYDDKNDGQMAVVGGTGEFVSAHGVIKYKKVQGIPNVESYREFNISASYPATSGYTCDTAIL